MSMSIPRALLARSLRFDSADPGILRFAAIWKPFTPVLYVGLWAGFWLLLCQALVASGAVWSLLGDRVASQRIYQPEAQVFAAWKRGRSLGRVFIGDRLFTAKIRSLADPKRDLVLEVPRFTMADVVPIVVALRQFQYDRLIFQLSPHLVSDYWFNNPTLDFYFWTNRGRWAPRLNAFRKVNEMLLAALRRGDKTGAERPVSLAAVRWTESPYRLTSTSDLGRSLEVLVPGGRHNIYWLIDRNATAPDAPEDLLARFSATFGTVEFNQHLGHIAPAITDIPKQ